MSKANTKKIHTKDARARMREAALSRYGRDAQENHDHVREVLKTIEKEMEANQGIYPKYSGGLSSAEVARRSGLHPNTFYKQRYKELGKEVFARIEKLKSNKIVGRTRVRKEMSTRVQEWRQMYEDLLDSFRLTEADLEVTQSKLDEALKENEILRERLLGRAGHKVVHIVSKGS